MSCRHFAAALLSVAVAMPFGTAPAEAAPRARAAGSVVRAADLTINGRPATTGALVRPGDRLKTGADGSADIVLANGAIFRLFGGTEAKLPVLAKKRSLVQLVAGGILSLVGKPMDYQVRAPKAVAAVSGTCFYMQATPDAPNYVCACSGIVHIGSPRSRARTPINSGFNLHVAMMVDELGFKPGGAKNHNDHMMWELGKELQQATGIANKYKALGGPDSSGTSGEPPAVETEPLSEPASP
jgi:hypothetical protein